MKRKNEIWIDEPEESRLTVVFLLMTFFKVETEKHSTISIKNNKTKI